jgi:hypothetical protein
VCEGLDRAWWFFGAMSKTLVRDNTKAIVKEPKALAPVLVAAFLDYVQARCIFVDPVRVRSPEDTPRVENQVPYVRESWFDGETFSDLADARLSAEHWSRDIAGAHPRHHAARTTRVVRVRREGEDAARASRAIRWTQERAHRLADRELDVEQSRIAKDGNERANPARYAWQSEAKVGPVDLQRLARVEVEWLRAPPLLVLAILPGAFTDDGDFDVIPTALPAIVDSCSALFVVVDPRHSRARMVRRLFTISASGARTSATEFFPSLDDALVAAQRVAPHDALEAQRQNLRRGAPP